LDRGDQLLKLDLVVGQINEQSQRLQRIGMQFNELQQKIMPMVNQFDRMIDDLVDQRVENTTNRELIMEKLGFAEGDWKARKRQTDNRMKGLRDLTADEVIEKGDMAKVSFRGRDADGVTLPRTEGVQEIQVGENALIPALEESYLGMKIGEEKIAVSVVFPEKYHSPDFAGKEVLFDVRVIDSRRPLAKSDKTEKL
jgi:hypothetical protein